MKDQQQVKVVEQDKHQVVQKVQQVVHERVEVKNNFLLPFFNAIKTRIFFLAEDLSELSQNPQFQALRQLIQQNPEQLQTLMQTLQATQPELFQVKYSYLKS